jgi:DNA-binding transcriptional LysR family regulator
MDLLKAMKVYEAIVDAGSLVAAAEKLDTSTTAVSRHVAALESHLGARLLNRTTRRISMTDVGKEFYGRAQTIMADIAEAEAVAGQGSLRPSGLLRISAPLSFGISKLSHWLPPFLDRFPDLKLDVDLSDRVIDLAAEGMDVAVRIGRQPASTNLIARRLAPVRMRICASPAYLDLRGRPSQPEDLTAHETLSYSYLSSGDHWTLTDRTGRQVTARIRPRVQATNGEILRDMALTGAGIIMQPSFIVDNDIAAGRLEPLLDGWNMDGFSLYAIYLSRQFLSTKVRAFIDHLIAMAVEKPT